MSRALLQSEDPIRWRKPAASSDALSGDQALQMAQHRIAQLRDEVSTLRQALLNAERASAQKEVLLRNMLRRELELRAQLVKGMF